MRRSRLVVIAVLAAALTPVAGGSGSSTATPPLVVAGPEFHPAACPAHAFPDRLDVDCGYVRVPEDRSDPQSRKIKVAAAVVHATDPQPGAEPILLLPGGASASAMTRFSVRAYLSGTKWDDAHDVVLVDTRGVGQSSPRLGCPEFDEAQARAIDAGPFVWSRMTPLLKSAIAHCRDRLTREGIAVENYTSDDAIADLEVLRRALDVGQWNLLAISADGILGMSYLRAHPESMRSVIVDSGMAPQMLGQLDYDRGQSADLQAVLDGCAANKKCRRTYPHLRRLFTRELARLDRHPAVIRLRHYRPHPITLRLDGMGIYWDMIHSIFPGNVFVPEEIHFLLEDLWRIANGEVEDVYRGYFGNGPTLAENSDKYVADGRTMSLECHDVISAITPRELRKAARELPIFAKRYRSKDFDIGHTIGNQRSPAGCRIWDVGRARPAQHEAVVSDVPTLVLAGGFDPGVPTYIVRKNMEGLSRATYVEFPASGHLQLAYFNIAHHCARDLARDFLDDPTSTLDTSCSEDFPEFDFTPPSERRQPRAAYWSRHSGM